MKSLYDNQHEAEMIERLKSLEITPPQGSWDDIQNTLKIKRRRSIVMFSSLASAATVALFFTISGINFISKNHNSTNQDNRAISQSKNKKTESVTIQPRVLNTENTIIPSEKKVKQINIDKRETIKPIEESNESKPQTEVLEPIQPIHSKPLISNSSSQSDIYQKIKSYQNYSSLASVENKKSKRKREWIISASGFPVYSFHTAGVMKKEGTKNESGMISWGGSISVLYSFSNSFSIESGIAISTIGEQEKNLFLASNNLRGPTVATDGASSSFGNLTLSDDTYKLLDAEDVQTVHSLIATNYTKVRGSQQFKYIEIPVLLARRFYFRGYKFNFKGGFSESILIGNKLDLTGDKISLSGKTVGMDTYSTSAIVAISLSIPIINKANLFIEPNLKVGLKSLSTSYGNSYPIASYIKFGVEVPL